MPLLPGNCEQYKYSIMILHHLVHGSLGLIAMDMHCVLDVIYIYGVFIEVTLPVSASRSLIPGCCGDGVYVLSGILSTLYFR